MFVCFHQYLITIFNQLGCNVHVRLLLLKTKSSKIASWPGFLASGKDSRTKVVLARKIEKQGLGSTPGKTLVWEWSYYAQHNISQRFFIFFQSSHRIERGCSCPCALHLVGWILLGLNASTSVPYVEVCSGKRILLHGLYSRCRPPYVGG